MQRPTDPRDLFAFWFFCFSLWYLLEGFILYKDGINKICEIGRRWSHL